MSSKIRRSHPRSAAPLGASLTEADEILGPSRSGAATQPTVNGNPAILPLSVAMKRHEADYLAALESFSRPARQLWDVTWIADNEFQFDFRSSSLACAH